jgi:hypothetical protein
LWLLVVVAAGLAMLAAAVLVGLELAQGFLLLRELLTRLLLVLVALVVLEAALAQPQILLMVIILYFLQSLLPVVGVEALKILHSPVVMGVRVAVAVAPAAVLEIHLLCPRRKEATVELEVETGRTLGQAVVAVLRLLAQMERQQLVVLVEMELHHQLVAHP